MREILFKAKRIDNGEWVKGFYCKMQETTYCFKEDYEKNPVPTHHFIIAERMTDWGMPNQLYKIRVDGDTICQCTDLTDMNGNKIWENDVVEFESHGYIPEIKQGVVVFNNGFYGIKYSNGYYTNLFHRIGEIDEWRDMGASATITYTYKVLGNIFDNHDLLKGGMK